MAKNIPAGLVSVLAGESTNFNLLIEITRTDGVEVLGTDSDIDIVVDPDGGMNTKTFLSDVAFSNSAIDNKEDLSVDNSELVGIVDASIITEQDLRNGLYDYARVRLFLVDREDPSLGVIQLREGFLGEVKITENETFFAELRGLMQQLSTRVVEISTPECRADLGDARCKVPIDPPAWATGIDYLAERFPAELSLKGDNEFRLPDSVLVSDWITPTTRNDRIFRVSVAGRSNPVEPTWNLTIDGATTQPWAGFTAWTMTEVIALGDVRRATVSPTDKLFVATTAGTTGGSEPTWDEDVDDTTADGTVVWTTYPLPPEWVTLDAFNKEGAVDGDNVFTPNRRVFQIDAGDIVAATGFYNFGILEWTSGSNTGRRHEAKDWINASGVYVEDGGSPNLDFIQQGGDDVARRDAGSWIDDGFTPGMRLLVAGSPSQNGVYLVNAVTALDLTIDGDWPAEDLNTTGSTLTGSLRQVTLFLPTAFDVADNDTFLMYPGCEKRLLADCRDKFENLTNHRGERYLSGNDARFSYPDARA